MRDSAACMWLIVENAEIFWSYIVNFWIFQGERNCSILIGLCKQVFMNHPIMFLDRDNKIKLELLKEKNKFELKNCDSYE